MAYDQKVRQVLFEMGDEIEIRAEYRQLASKIFNTTVFRINHAGSNYYQAGESTIISSQQTPTLINEMIGEIQLSGEFTFPN